VWGDKSQIFELNPSRSGFILIKVEEKWKVLILDIFLGFLDQDQTGEVRLLCCFSGGQMISVLLFDVSAHCRRIFTYFSSALNPIPLDRCRIVFYFDFRGNKGRGEGSIFTGDALAAKRLYKVRHPF
jgi:hypothetical protein